MNIGITATTVDQVHHLPVVGSEGTAPMRKTRRITRGKRRIV